MVTFSGPLRTRAVLLLAVACSWLLSGCAPRPTMSASPDFRPTGGVETVYVVPFASALVPELFSETAFNDFVDLLSGRRRETGITSFVILKEEVKEVDPAWLARQLYISGDIWSYVEDSGCCTTNIRVKARAYLHEPGRKEPVAEIFVPLEAFFDHDRSTVERERDRLARTLAREFADRFAVILAPRR